MQAERISRERKPGIPDYYGYIKVPNDLSQLLDTEDIPVIYCYCDNLYQRAVNDFFNANPNIRELIDSGELELVVTESNDGMINISVVEA